MIYIKVFQSILLTLQKQDFSFHLLYSIVFFPLLYGVHSVGCVSVIIIQQRVRRYADTHSCPIMLQSKSCYLHSLPGIVRTIISF